MAKQQKTVQLPPDIYVLCETYEGLYGTRWNRQVLAALLGFAFGDVVAIDDEDAASIAPDRSLWLEVAVQIERGELEVLDVPLMLLDSFIEDSERRLRRRQKGLLGTIDPKCVERSIEIYRERKRGWENNIEDFGGKLEAVRHHLKPFST